ncbi:MAG: hypothetical protein DME71_10070 [Verrucomicrobia bacterium]|nr:MAG: hypothetical protein DME71_10070 [Verrucomicrobiota bacterium]
MADVAVRGAELFSVKLPKTSQHLLCPSEDGFDLSRPCDQVLEFASADDVLPNDYTGLNHSFATAAGGVISTANLRFMTVS